MNQENHLMIKTEQKRDDMRETIKKKHKGEMMHRLK